MKKIILAGLLLSMAIITMAQDSLFPRLKKNNSRYWILGIGNSGQNMYDEAISRVRYQGSGIAPVIGLIKNSERKHRQLMILPSFITMTTKRRSELRPMEAKTTRIAVDYQYLVKAKEWNGKLKLYLGGNAGLLFNLKRAEQLDNSQLLYDYALSIGPAAKLDKNFKWRKRECFVSYNLSVPLLSHIARPYYLNRIEFIDPKNDFVGDLLNNSSLTSINKHLRIKSGLSLTYPLFNKNALRLGYAWDFYTMKTITKVYAAEHLVSIAFLSNY